MKSLKKSEKKLKTFEPEIQDLYNAIAGFELDTEYSVSGLEAKLKGIDILAIQNIWIKYMKGTGIWNKFDVLYRANSNDAPYLIWHRTL